MTTALIFAGGAGIRMSSKSKPKQFLELHGKPIIIYTLEHFENHEEVDAIVVVCIEGWIDELKAMMMRYGITKVKDIVAGGETGHDSIYFGLQAMQKFSKDDDIVLIHDGVRPLITEELISMNIDAVKKYGNAITCEPVRESVIRSLDGVRVESVPLRSEMFTAKAPQSFYYKKILELHKKAKMDGRKTIDSAHLCNIYNEPMYMVPSTKNNIKITEPADFYICRALYDVQENQQIFGL